MKKLSSSLKNMLLVLTLVTAISVSMLALVNEVTKKPIKDANLKMLNVALSKILPEFDNSPVSDSDTIFSETKDGKKKVDFIIYKAKKDDELVATAIQTSSIGFSGELKILVSFDKEGKIFNYSLLQHSETPGLGSKAETWFGAYDNSKGEKAVHFTESSTSIIGINPNEGKLQVKKDGGNIDAITGSTITSRAFLNAVQKAFEVYSSTKKETP